MRYILYAILVSMIFFSGCKTLEPESAKPVPLKIEDSFSFDPGGSESIENWWHSFGSKELNALISDALENNFDLKTLEAIIEQAKASVEKKEAPFLPKLDFSTGAQKRRTKVKSSNNNNSRYNTTDSYSGLLNGYYTIDVWGEAKADLESQVFYLKSAEQNLNHLRHQLTTDIASIWIDILAVRDKINILKNQIRINNVLLELQKLRFANGKANALDVSQQQEALSQTSSQLPVLEKQELLLLNQLALLSGGASVDNLSVNTSTLPAPVSFPQVGIPSDLLANRADIQSARLRLSSAQWEVTAAKADLLPSFMLSAQALFTSGKLDLLFQNWIATLAASISGPIFDGGFRKAEVKRLQAVVKEQLNIYGKIVSNAIIEVEDSLISIQKQSDYIKLLEQELDVTKLTLRDAMIQYQNGQSSYLSYLISWTRIERLERQLIGERAIYIKDQIDLYQALGWQPEPESLAVKSD